MHNELLEHRYWNNEQCLVKVENSFKREDILSHKEMRLYRKTGPICDI